MQRFTIWSDRLHNRLHVKLLMDFNDEDVMSASLKVIDESKKLKSGFAISIQDDQASVFPQLYDNQIRQKSHRIGQRKQLLNQVLAPLVFV
jgi:hypothetical protein